MIADDIVRELRDHIQYNKHLLCKPCSVNKLFHATFNKGRNATKEKKMTNQKQKQILVDVQDLIGH
jgi:hypothetical protein